MEGAYRKVLLGKYITSDITIGLVTDFVVFKDSRSEGEFFRNVIFQVQKNRRYVALFAALKKLNKEEGTLLAKKYFMENKNNDDDNKILMKYFLENMTSEDLKKLIAKKKEALKSEIKFLESLKID